MRQAYLNSKFFKARRDRLAKLLPKGAALVLPSWPEHDRNFDNQFLYRPDSNLLYLCGIDEPGSCLVFRPGQTPETILFVRPKNIERETWDGFRFGPEAAKAAFGVDEVHLIDEVETKAAALLKECETVYYSLYRNKEFDPVFGNILAKVKASRPRSGLGFPSVADAYGVLGELRMKKTEEEIEIMRKACSASAHGHIEVMKATRPGATERALQGLFIKTVMEEGCFGEAYPGIFATGVNAVTLHYRFNESTLQDGELFLVDAGGEYKYYSGDITRTYPVSGKFSPAQKSIYSALCELQEKLIETVKPGVEHATLQQKTIAGIAEILIHEKLCKGSVDEVVSTRSFAKYYMHGVSHLLGMDTHDAGSLIQAGKPRQMEEGWVFSMEPGIYVPADDTSAPKELRGLGIRIEDDILVTSNGYENMTHEAPKTVKEMEAIIGQG